MSNRLLPFTEERLLHILKSLPHTNTYLLLSAEVPIQPHCCTHSGN